MITNQLTQGSQIGATKSLKTENETLLNDIQQFIKEIQTLNEKQNELKGCIEEKDKIIKLLYLEIDDLRNQVRVSKGPSPSLEDSAFKSNPEIKESKNEMMSEKENSLKEPLESLKNIKFNLLEFLKYFEIDVNKDLLGVEISEKVEDAKVLSKGNRQYSCLLPEKSISSLAKEIQLISVNFKKVNIIFKNTCKNIAENMFNSCKEYADKYIEDQLQNIFNKLSLFKSKILALVQNKKISGYSSSLLGKSTRNK